MWHTVLSLFVALSSCTDEAVASRFPLLTNKDTWSFRQYNQLRPAHERLHLLAASFRGGDSDGTSKPSIVSTEDEDEERYSRQVYTLGARAHGLIRSATVYLDGPARAGLVYECAKNLALSGVHRLVIVTNRNDETAELEQHYHDSSLDDLGQMYQRGARAEVSSGDDAEPKYDDDELLVEYLRRLNPNIIVTSLERSALEQTTKVDDNDTDGITKNSVFLCIDRPYATQVALNRLSRSRNWAFVALETAGVFGRVFCDFGPTFLVHDADGETPTVTPLDRIERVDETDHLVVHAVTGEKHDVSKGDTIEFQHRNGELAVEQCAVTIVHSPYKFEVAFATADQCSDIHHFVSKINQEAASFRRVKVPQELKFDSIEKVIEAAKQDYSLFTPCDLEKSFDANRRSASLSCFQALSEFVDKYRRLPVAKDEAKFLDLAKATWTTDNCDDGEGKKHCRSFVRGCAAKFSPFQAVFGAIGAQEVLKAISGLYFPVKQLLLYDCDEVLGRAPKSKTASDLGGKPEVLNCGLRHILGDSIVEKLQKKKVFVVGAGAIGCEILKNLASIGVGTHKKGKVVLTDMDTIEKSNLSRQFLFRDNDIGKFKSIAAQEAATRLNPWMKVEAHSSKVGTTGSGPFDVKFWSKKVDIVLNALDNVEARLYMDAQCVSHKKALIDAGTMGPKGNVQVVVPYQSESYSSSADPPEPSIPVCTLKNFPYAISHTIQWGRDIFDGLFERRPQQANDFVDGLSSSSIEELATRFVQDKGDEAAIEAAIELKEDVLSDVLSKNVQVIRDHALRWSAALAKKLFYESSADLLAKHPLNSVDEDGEQFWGGTRRPPKLLSFIDPPNDEEQVTINNNIVEFIRNCARLRVETILGSSCSVEDTLFTEDEAMSACISAANKSDDKCSDSISESAVSRVRASLSEIHPGSQRLTSIDFEKDDDSNGHVAFVSAASNLRAIAYGIPPVDAMETRRVAGNIVPAMITTTAFVSALSCIELIKLVQRMDLKRHRNAFINLALPFFAFTVPLPAETMPGLNGKTYTLWDQLSIIESEKAAKAGGMTIKTLLRKIKAKASDESSEVEIASISFGPLLLYANFLHEDDEELLNTSVWKLVNDAVASNDDFESEHSRSDDIMRDIVVVEDYVDLAVAIEDANTGDEVELPPLRVQRFRKTTGSSA